MTDLQVAHEHEGLLKTVVIEPHPDWYMPWLKFSTLPPQQDPQDKEIEILVPQQNQLSEDIEIWVPALHIQERLHPDLMWLYSDHIKLNSIYSSLLTF